MKIEFNNGEYRVTADPNQIDVQWVHAFLAESYWAKNVPLEVVKISIKNSLAFGLFKGDEPAGFGRAVTDRATFAYLADIFVDEAHRGRGLGKWLIQCIFDHPDLYNLRRWMLITEDAHGLYENFGFKVISTPGKFMEIKNHGVYDS